jgi:hypothetical protein
VKPHWPWAAAVNAASCELLAAAAATPPDEPVDVPLPAVPLPGVPLPDEPLPDDWVGELACVALGAGVVALADGSALVAVPQAASETKAPIARADSPAVARRLLLAEGRPGAVLSAAACGLPPASSSLLYVTLHPFRSLYSNYEPTEGFGGVCGVCTAALA